MRKPLINNWIRAREVRLIDKNGKNLGVLNFGEALKMAQEQNLDLIQVTEKVEPPVCKIADYGKYLYYQQKKERKNRIKKSGELKNIRLTFKISSHDMGTRARKAMEFLEKGNKVRIEMFLRGRERELQDFAREKVGKFLEMIKEKIPIKIERELKRERRGLAMIIVKE